MDNQILDELRGLLERNYDALGFELLEFGLSVPDQLDGLAHAGFVNGKIRCPCGAAESFMLAAGCVEGHDVRDIAREILASTASRAHLQKDVADGTLPAFELEKHVFKDLI